MRTETTTIADQPAGVDQQLVVHLFMPADGPSAEAAYAGLRDLWLGCRQFFLMREAIPGTGLPQHLPPTFRELITSAGYLADEETALAGQERPDADCQAILRRHHDVLNLSIVLAGPEGTSAPASGHSWWQDLDSQWSFLSDRVAATMLGEARIYLARSAARPGRGLDELLPAAARVSHWELSRAATEGGLAVWEASPWTDGRTLRRLVLAFDDEAQTHELASSWAWSRGDVAIPPLARYLLQAAKLRARYREWRSGADGPDHARQSEPPPIRLRTADLRSLRQSVEIAEHNMGLVVGSAGLLAPEGPFADDLNLARWLRARLEDSLSYLAIAADLETETGPNATGSPARTRAPAPTPAAARPAGAGRAGLADDITRNVFVVHGRDDQAASALFGFLEALGLQPLGWETLVEATGTAAPYLRDVIVQGIAMAQAAVVLMTPDDTVRLHPGLQAPYEDEHEVLTAMQARPNVILELGMALATYADRTVVLVAGKHRPMADLSGLNYIRLTDSDECRDKIRRRLQTAGCRVDEKGAAWRARAWFADLAAYTRRPSAIGLGPGGHRVSRLLATARRPGPGSSAAETTATGREAAGGEGVGVRWQRRTQIGQNHLLADGEAGGDLSEHGSSGSHHDANPD
jgi:predicted nucleotide-binding protein